MDVIIGSLEFITLSYFLYVVLYAFIFLIGGIIYSSKTTIHKSAKLHQFIVFIPAYKEDNVIVDVATKALEQSYPNASYTVCVIADSLQPQTIEKLHALPIETIEVKFDVSTKVRALNCAMQSLAKSYDYAVILDADNVMEPDFLTKMNGLIALHGYKAIQGQRVPKNKNNSLAFLDGISEAINNMLYRQGASGLHLSSSISGSGVVFEYPLFKRKLATMTSIGGFDRELELLLLEEKTKVFYYRDAIVYDEKVSQINTFENQRRRWISSQYHYLQRYFKKGMRALAGLNISYFNSSILRNIQMPRLINLGLLFIFTAIAFIVQDSLHFGYLLWLALLVINVTTIFCSIPKKFYTRELVVSIFSIPAIFFRMLMLMFKLKGANKKFIHTPHGVADKP